jgi:hypothetical protein
MVRNRQSAKASGTRHETSIVNYFAQHWDDRIERRTRNGALDRGDVSGLRHMNVRVVAELKEYGGRFLVGTWLTEVDTERRNDDAAVGLVIAKRRGTTDPGDQVVFMTVRDLTALVTGSRPADAA